MCYVSEEVCHRVNDCWPNNLFKKLNRTLHAPGLLSMMNYVITLSKWLCVSNSKRTEWSPIRSVIIRGRPICSSRAWLQTELDDTKSYYQLIIKITISEKRRIAKLWKKGKICINWTDKRRRKHSMATAIPTVIRRHKHKSKCACTHACTRNYNFECDWLI